MLLDLEGFDNDNHIARIVESFSYENAYSYLAGRSGGRSRRIASGYWYDSEQLMWYTYPTPIANPGVGFAITYGNAPISVRMVGFYEDATLHLFVDRSADGLLQLKRGDGTILGTGTVAFSATSWNYLELHAVIADGAAGSAKLWLNGSPQIEVSGVDTRNGGTTGLVSKVQWSTGAVSPGNGFTIDDMYFADGTGAAPYNGPLGDLKVETLRPAAPGAVSAWVGSDGNSVDNWAMIDDNADATDYIGSAAVGARDLSELTNLTAPVGTDIVEVLAVQVAVLAAKADAGTAAPLLSVLRDSGGTVDTDLVAVSAALTTSYQWFNGPLVTLAPDGLEWTYAKANALQAGVEVGVA